MLGQPLRTGGVAQATIEQRLDLGVPSRKRITHHHQVDGTRQILLTIAFHQGDARLRELRAHRWIHIGIGAAHLMAQFPRE